MVGYLAQAQWRGRWRAVVVLAFVAGVAGAVVLASVAAARRGPDALDRFVASFGAADGTIFVFGDETTPEEVAHVAAADADVAGWLMGAYVVAVERGARANEPGAYSAGLLRVDETAPIELPQVIEGRLPDPTAPFEIAVNDVHARRSGVRPGDTIELGLLGSDQIDRLDDEPALGIHPFTVVGITRSPTDLTFQNAAQPGTYQERDGEEVTWSPGLWRAFDGELAHYGVGVALTVVEGADPEAVLTRVAEPFGEAVFTGFGSEDAVDLAQVRQSVGQQANATRAFAAVIGVAATVLVVQAIRRHVASTLLAHPALSALGVTRSDRRRARLLWAAPVAAGAGVVAAGVAVLLSQLGPIGVARRAELDPGIDVDLAVISVGALAVAAGVLAAAAAPARGARSRLATRRPSRLAERAPTPPTAVGTALARGVPVGGAARGPSLAALPIAVLAVTAAVVFGSSLSRATGSPDAYGWHWDYAAGNCSTPQCVAESDRRLGANPAVAAWTGINSATGRIGGVEDDLLVEIVHPGRGWAGGQILRGAPPTGDGDAVLAEATARESGVGIGDEVTLGLEGGTEAPFTVVGLYRPASMFVEDQAQDVGAAVTEAGAQRAVPADLREIFTEEVVPQYFLIDLAPEADHAAAVAQLERDFPAALFQPFRPDRLEAAYRLRSLPTLLAAVIAVLGIGALLHLAGLAAVRRRTTLAMLAAIGFTRTQRQRVVATELAVIVGVAVAVGVPAGVVAGRLGWMIAADGLGSTAGPRAPLLGVAIVALVGAGAAVIVGHVAGAVAARRPAASGLRATA
jgi:hypothetical protein